jgi:hypothetical protein
MWNEQPAGGPVVWTARRGRESELAQALSQGIEHFGIPFFQALWTLENVAEYLIGFDCHPRKVEVDGLRSVAREVRLPLVLSELGRLSDAAKWATRFQEEAEAGLAAGVLPTDFAQCRICELSLVRQFLSLKRQ